MAGGQSASFEQGSPGVSGTVALSGSAITSGIGLLNVGSDTYQAATGQAMSSAIGSTGSARLILLKSRKVGGGAASFALTGVGLTMTPGVLVKDVSSPLVGSVATLAQGAMSKQRSMLLTGQSLSPITGSMSASGSIPSSDWNTRIAGAGVVWYHKFDTAVEMNRFRWSNSSPQYPTGSGNNPNGDLGTAPENMAWHATGGPGGGPYISFYHEVTGRGSGQKWCRPFSPMDGTSNGRGIDDPGAGLPLQTFTPTPGGDQTVAYSNRSNPGYYGKAGYEGSGVYNGNPLYPQVAKVFDGNDFYFQIRVKQDPAAMTYGTPKPNGKFFFLTTTTTVTNCNQEVVTVTRWPTPTSAGAGQPNYHTMYEGGFSQLDNGNGTVAADGSYVGKIWNPPVNSDNSTYGTGKVGWYYSGGWDTLMYHVTPGTDNAASGGSIKDTRIEVWAAHQGETSYTKIWDTKYAAFFSNPEQYTTGHLKYGWNAITLANYQNIDLGDTVAAPHTQSFAEIIFSKAAIPCPQDYQYSGTLSLDSLSVIGQDSLPGSAFDAISGQTYVTSKPRWWMYSQVTKDGTIIRLGDDAHGQTPPQWNGLREFNPVTGVTTNVYANNFNRNDVNRMNNKVELYLGQINYLGQARDLWVRAPGCDADRGDNAVWDRSTSTWLVGALPPAVNNGRRLVGTGSQDLMYQDATVDATLRAAYNPHFAWSSTYQCGFILGGSPGGNGPPAQTMWIIAPSSSALNATAVAQGNPLTIWQKPMPTPSQCISQWGEPVYRMRAAMACCFAGEYVYWFGGCPYGDDPPGPFTSKAFFRMKITPHLTNKSLSVTSGAGAIQRLTDGPVATAFGLLSYDPYLNCIVAWAGSASTACIWAYDLSVAGSDGVGTWVNVNPAAWTAVGSFGGDSLSPPESCQGGYIDTCNGQSVKAHVFSPGRTSYGATNMESFFKLKLKRV